MITRIARHELRILLTDRTLMAIVLVLATVVLYGLANGLGWIWTQRSVLDEAARREATRMTELNQRMNVTGPSGSTVGVAADLVGSSLGTRYAALPPAPLGALMVGQSDLLPNWLEVSTEAQGSFTSEEEVTNPNELLTGRFDLGFVIITLYPLVILAMSYNLLSSEKEGGTLVLLLSQPLRLGSLVLAKVLVRGLVVAGLAVIIAAIGFVLSGSATEGVSAWTRLGLWLAATLLYGGFWFALAVAVNAKGRSSATNAVILASAWLLLVNIIPALVNLSTQLLYPMPSRIELVQAVREASDEARTEGTRLNARFFEDHPELAGEEADVSQFAVQTLATREAIEASIAGTLDRFEVQLTRQQAWVDRFRWISPAIVASEVLQDASGTGSARHRRFLEQVEQFRDRWQDHFRPLVLDNRMLGPEDLDGLPTFTYQEEPIGMVTRRIGLGLVEIALPTGLVILVGSWWLRRYPILG